MSPSRPTDPEHGSGEFAPQQRQPLSQRTYDSVLDQRIAAAQADGMFDNLPGAGKPQRFEDDSSIPEEDRVGYRILKNAGFAPPWIELQKTIREEQAKLEAWLAHANRRWSHITTREQERLCDDWNEQIVKLNRLIVHYNLAAPKAAGQLPTLRLPEELPRLGK